MIGGLYVPGASLVHRLPAGAKLLALAVCGTALFLVDPWPALAAALGAVAALYAAAGLGRAVLWRQIRPALPLLALLALVQLLVAGPATAAAVALRFAALILLAGLVTVTTATATLIEALERALRPFQRVGVDPERVAMAISLAIRFIPALGLVLQEVREAQRARGADRSILALGVPLLVRTLKMADEVAEAIDARS